LLQNKDKLYTAIYHDIAMKASTVTRPFTTVVSVEESNIVNKWVHLFSYVFKHKLLLIKETHGTQ